MGVLTPIAPGIHYVSRWIFNCYVIEIPGDQGERRMWIVDPGIESNARAATRLEGSVSLITATHLHSDHVAAIPYLLERTDAKVALPERAQRYVEHGETPRSPGLREVAKIAAVFGDQPFELGAVAELIRGATVAGYAGAKCLWPESATPKSGLSYLRDGDRLPGAPDWRVIVASGHTDDSTAFYNAKTATLLSGDAVLSCGGQAWFTPELTDPARARETEERLRALRVDTLLPGHGRPLRGHDLMKRAKTR